MLRETLSAKNLLDALTDRARIHVNYRIRRGEDTEYCQATIVRNGDWRMAHDIILGLRSVDVQTREEMKKRALLEEALTQANKANAAKSAFLSNMSHDIRTPMNAIVGFTTLAASRIDQPERVQEYLGKIQSSSAHLLSLINDILDMSHIESGKVSLDEQPYNLVDLLDDLYSIIQAETSARQLYFTVDTTGVRHADVRCDKLRINQILLNLLGNALKFTNPGGFVKVKVDELDGAPAGYGRYRFIVSDTGIGMSPEFVEHIFDPFERERTSTISGIQGTGLGMTITKNLVDMMHGSIAVKSVQGKGTAFTIELTLQLAGKRAAAAHESKAPHANARHHLQKSRILLVDDNDLNRENRYHAPGRRGAYRRVRRRRVRGGREDHEFAGGALPARPHGCADARHERLRGNQGHPPPERSDPREGAHFGHDRRRLRGRPPEGAAQRHGRPPLQAHRD